MATPASTPDVMSKLHRAGAICFLALSAFVALGVAVLFLALLGTTHTYSAAPQQPAGHPAPLIEFHDRGSNSP